MAKPFAAIASRALRTAEGKNDSRRKLMMAVRAACRRADLDDDDRRALQIEITGCRSMSDMTLAQIGQLLDHLNKGWKGPMGHRAHVGKIKALWWSLYWLGAIEQPTDAALDVFIKRQTGMGALRFVDHGRAPAVIEALKAMAEREGVRWPTDAQLADLQAHGAVITIQQLERHRVLDAIAAKLHEKGEFHSYGKEPYLEAALKLGPNQWRWTVHELDAGLKLLGKRLRRAIDRERDAG